MDRNLAMSRNLLNITIIKNCSFYFLIYFIDYAITVVPFPPLYSLPSCTPTPIHIPPLQFISMGRTYKFFSFYISYTLLHLPSTLYVLFMLLIPYTFYPILPLPFPTDNPPYDLHFCDSLPVLVVCLLCFFFFRFGC